MGTATKFGIYWRITWLNTISLPRLNSQHIFKCRLYSRKPQKTSKLTISQFTVFYRLSGVVVHSLAPVQEVTRSNPGLTTSAIHLPV